MNRTGRISLFAGLMLLVPLVAACGAGSIADDLPESLVDDSDLTGCVWAKVIAVQASTDDGNAAANVLDGSLGTRWSGFGIGAHITAEFGSARSFCNARIAWYRGDLRTNKFTISVSQDGTRFTPVYSGTSSGLTLQAETYALPAGTSGRFLRVTVNGNSESDWASITELSAYAMPLTTTTPSAPDAGTTVADAGVAAPANPCGSGSMARFVSPAGNDGYSGTQANPWRTLQRAADSAIAGDLICVKAGTYAERVYVSRGGTEAAPVRFLATPGERVVVTKGFYVKASYAIVEGFEITPAAGLGSGARNPDYTYADAPLQLSGSGNVARGNFVHDLADAAPWAILTTGAKNVVEKNRIHNAYRGHISASGSGVAIRDNTSTIDPAWQNAKPNNWKSIQLGLGSTNGMLVEGNTFRGPGDGNMIHVPVAVSNVTFRRNTIQLPGRKLASTTHTQTFGFYASATNVTFDGNVIGSAEPFPSGYVAGFTHFFFGTTDASGVFSNLVFTNNLFLGQLDGAYYIQFKAGDQLRGLSFANNLVDVPSSWRLPDSHSGVTAKNNIVLRGSVGGARDYNLYAGAIAAGEGSHSKSGDPMFVNPDKSAAAGYGVKADWHLRAGSPAINAGIQDATTPAADRDGKARLGTPDIGPYEY